MKRNYRILGTEWRLFKDSIYYRLHAWFCFMGKNWNMLSLQKFSLRILFCLDIFDGRETMYRESIHTQRRWIRNISQPQQHGPIITVLVNRRHKMMSIFSFAINCKHNLWRQRAQTMLKAIRRWFIYTDITEIGGFITITFFM